MSTPAAITTAGPTPSAPTLLGALPDDERAGFEAPPRRLRRLPRGGRRAARRRRRAARSAAPPVAPPPALKAADHGRRRARGRRCSRPPARRPTARAGAAARRRRSRAALVVPPGARAGPPPALLRRRRRRRRRARRRRRPTERTVTAQVQAGGRRAGDARGRTDGQAPRSSRASCPQPPSGPRLPGVARAQGARRPSRPTRCSRRAATARRPSSVPGSLDGVQTRAGHREPRGGSRDADRRAGAHAQPERTLDGRLLASRAPHGHLLPPPDRETGVSCSNCGRPDLPGLHDADAGRHALPGVRAPEDAGADDARRCTRDPIATYVLIAINVLMFLGAIAAAARRRPTDLGCRPASTRSPAGASASPGRVLAAGHRRLPARAASSTSASTCTCCTGSGRCSSRRSATRASLALYFTSLLAGSFGALLLAPADQPTVGASGAVFGLMGGRRRDAARPRDRPDAERASAR